jgi:two-component system chemotaxis sensor kinase CheA
LAVLTEYEEHRLRTNIQQGQSLYRLRVTFELLTIDEDLNALKARAKPYGEIITYLPTGEGAGADSIELDIIMASSQKLDGLRATLGNDRTRVDEIPRRAARPEPSELLFMSGRRDDARPGTPATSTDPGDVGAHGASPTGRPPPAESIMPPPPTPSTDGMHRESGRGEGRPPSPGDGGRRSMIPRAPRDPRHLGAPGVEGVTLRSLAQTVRVDIRKLDLLMNMVGELSIVKNSMERLTDRLRKSIETRPLAGELQRLHRSFERHLSEIQGGILEVRMVPLGQVFDKLARVVRQISRELGKEVNLVITGAETEVDKLIVEELSDPLMHMIRNAIDHGIEARAEREQVDKPAVGTIALNAFQKASHVVIEVEDDGRGLNETKLVAAAVRRGMMTEDQVGELDRSAVFNLIFLPGLTTRSDVGELSGRGVGMDVVKTNIGKLGGIIDVYSEPGIGTKFTVTLPITLAIISALIVRVAGRTFAVPLSSILEAIWLEPSAVKRVEGREMMTLRGSSLPLCRLRDLFAMSDPEGAPPPGLRPYAVVVGVGSRRLGLVVDSLVGQQDIVVKSLGSSLKKVRGFSGASELGDQRIALVIDAPAILEEVLSTGGEGVFAGQGAFAHA